MLLFTKKKVDSHPSGYEEGSHCGFELFPSPKIYYTHVGTHTHTHVGRHVPCVMAAAGFSAVVKSPHRAARG